jgi:protein phosphatase
MQVHQASPGDVLLLCSDGLTSMVADDEIIRVISESGDGLEEISRRLVAAANERGGEDNITVVLLRFEADPPG